MKRFILILGITFIWLRCFAQANFQFYDEISTPPTDSWEFIKQGNITPSLYTGTINLSIPIYTYQDNDFTIPIAAHYYSSGNQPNVRSGILGPGWTLPLGGCITLEINGIPDYGKNFFNVPGFLTLHSDSLFYNTIQLDKLWRFMYVYDGADDGATCPQIIYCPIGTPNQNHTNVFDAEPDIFHFNFMGHSGSFHLDFSNKIEIFDIQGHPLDYKIELFTHPHSTDPYDYTRIDSISITTLNGYKYLFMGKGNNVDRKKDSNTGRYDIICCYHLTKIIAPNKRFVLFEYDSIEQENYLPASSYYQGNIEDNQYRFWEADNISYFPIKEQDPNQINKIQSKNAILRSVNINDQATISLDYQTFSSQAGDQYKDHRLSELKNYSNTYRLNSISVIYHSPVQQQLASSTTFNYKSNPYGGKNNYLWKINISGEGTYSMDYHQWDNSAYPFPYNGSLYIDDYGYYNGRTNVYYPNILLDNSKQEETITSTDRISDYNFALCGVLSKITFPTGGYTTFSYEPNDYSIAVERPFNFVDSLSHRPKLIKRDGITSGVRISSISTFLSNNTLVSKKRYIYSDSLGSSGILCYTPRYSISYDSFAGPFVREGAIYKSSSIHNYNTTHIEYRSVKEILADSSSTLHLFASNATSKEYRDQVLYGPTVAEPFKTTNNQTILWNVSGGGYSTPRVHYAVAPITSRQILRGEPLTIIRYSKDYTPISISNYQYNIKESFSYIPTYLVRRFGTYPIFTGSSKLTNCTTKNYSASLKDYTKQEQFYTYNDYNELTSLTIVTSDNDSLSVEYKHLRDLSIEEIAANPIYQIMQDKFILDLPLEEKTYSIKNGVKYLIDGTIYEYSLFENLIKPHRIFKYLKEEGWVETIVIERYDKYGNITQIREKDGTVVSYIWGMNGQLLLCKAEGLTYDEILNIIGTQTLWTSLNQSIKDRINDCYPNALLTFIDHNLRGGITLIETPDKQKQRFHYTEWGKLQKKLSGAYSEIKERIEYSNEANY